MSYKEKRSRSPGSLMYDTPFRNYHTFRFYQFRRNKIRTGPYLTKLGQAADNEFWWCSGLSQTRCLVLNFTTD
jgi:hypothetical protein